MPSVWYDEYRRKVEGTTQYTFWANPKRDWGRGTPPCNPHTAERSINVITISGKVSFHEGKRFSLRHNIERASGEWNKDGHINPNLIAENVVLMHKPLRNFFDETFSEAIADFNLRNERKHPDRVTSVSAYYQKYKNQAKESIIQFGDTEEFKMLVEAVGAEQAREIHKQFLTSVFEYWQKENPNLKIFGAYIHCDEAVPHLHLDYLPVTTSDRGLTVRVSRDGALSKYTRLKSFKRDNDGNLMKDESGNTIETETYAGRKWVQWEQETRINLEQIAAEIQLTADQKQKIEIEVIPHEPQSKKHDEKWQYEQQALEYYLANPEPPEVLKRPRKKDLLSALASIGKTKEEQQEIYQQKVNEYKKSKSMFDMWQKGKELANSPQNGYLQQQEEQAERDRQAIAQQQQQIQSDRQAIAQQQQQIQADRQRNERNAERNRQVRAELEERERQMQKQIQEQARQIAQQLFEQRMQTDLDALEIRQHEADLWAVLEQYLPEQIPQPEQPTFKPEQQKGIKYHE